jgi:hypothetical protein
VVKVMRRFDPLENSVAGVDDGFLGRLAIRHAAGQIVVARDEAGTVLFGQRLDNERVIRGVDRHGGTLTGDRSGKLEGQKR